MLGVALTVTLIGHDGLVRANFTSLYGLHAGLAVLTGMFCLLVNTRPKT